MLKENNEFGDVKYIFVDDDILCDFIRNAQVKINFTCAGLSMAVALALISKKEIVNEIYLDNDISTYKIGYGEVGPLRKLKDAGIKVFTGCTTRINILVVDNYKLIYSPTPEVIEKHDEKHILNGVILECNNHVTELDAEKDLPSPDMSGLEQLAMSNSNEITEEINEKVELAFKDIENVEQEVEKYPPKIDLNRQLNVYTSKLQFIELSLNGFSFKRHTINIPKRLLKLSQSRSKENKLKATYKLFQEPPIMADNISQRILGLKGMYTKNFPGVGTIFLLKDKNQMEKEIGEIEEEIKKCKNDIANIIQEEIEKTKIELTDVLKEVVKRNPPKELIKNGKNPSEEVIVKYIRDTLEETCLTTDDYISGMKLTHHYKDITIEMLENQDFIDFIKNSFVEDASFDNNSIVKKEKTYGTIKK